MRVRADSAFVSSLLHTIALLYLIRPALWNYFAGSHKALVARMDEGFRAEAQMSHYFGVARLAIILIGLIVVWTGYVRRSRSAWFVMFVVVWLWAFPLFILPDAVLLIRGKSIFTFSELIYNAMLGPGLARTVVEVNLIFLLMVVGLVLPIGRFFVAGKADEPIHTPSRRLVGVSLIAVIVAMTALFFWMSVGVLYEIPNPQLIILGPIPPPPPPPTPCKCPDGN